MVDTEFYNVEFTTPKLYGNIKPHTSPPSITLVIPTKERDIHFNLLSPVLRKKNAYFFVFTLIMNISCAFEFAILGISTSRDFIICNKSNFIGWCEFYGNATNLGIIITACIISSLICIFYACSAILYDRDMSEGLLTLELKERKYAALLYKAEIQ
jgi:hypothetical protein